MTAEELVNEFTERMQSIDDKHLTVMIAIARVENDYETSDSPIATLVGGAPIKHRVYGDMLCLLGKEIASFTTTSRNDGDFLDRLFGIGGAGGVDANHEE